jgi:hypothetical protein
MITMSHLPKSFATLAACLALALPVSAFAQNIAYGGTDNSDDTATSSAPETGRVARRGHVTVTPYIEAAQVATAQLSPSGDVLTYSTLAAGVDASIVGRNSAASVSLRYEHRFGWSKRVADGDMISGVARASTAIIPHALYVEAGALATRTRVDGNGASLASTIGNSDSVTQTYSVYAGPTFSTHAGDVAIDGGYRLGYTRVNSPDAIVTAPGATPVDVFDSSVVHSARIHAGTKAGTVLPVGVGIGAGYDRENISNLDQQVEDFHARADVLVPVSSTVAVVGGVGYEDVSVSSRDALRDGSGNAVVGSDGRYVTNKSGPRILSYDTSGLIWDVGVMWKPSRRTAFEAHYGRRYGSDTYYGIFAYAPNSKSSINVSVYDAISGFGGQVNRALAALPAEFQAVRNPLTGDMGGCVASLSGGNCLSGVLGSVRSSTFRSRGVTASYGVNLGRLQAGIGAGYDRRTFIASAGTILASANGLRDENIWLSGYLNGRIDQRSSFGANVYANWFQSGYALAGDTSVIGASASYNRSLTNRLSATAAVGIDSINRDAPLEDSVTASALVGLRMSF